MKLLSKIKPSESGAFVFFFLLQINLLVNNKGYKSSHLKVNVLLKNPTVKQSE